MPTVLWRDDGTPTSPRFGDIYRHAGVGGAGGLTQAREVFLHGCRLLPGHDGSPAAWAGAARWAVLETGFGLGLNFLATWQAWAADPTRPGRLYYSAVEAFVPEPADLIRSAAPFPELHALAAELAAQWRGLLPGLHRIALVEGRVQLTLAVGEVRPMLAELSGAHDSLYLDGFSPEHNPEMWRLPTLKAASRLLRHGAHAATWCVAREVREHLTSCGFQVERVPGVPPKRHALHARYAPHWARPRRAADPEGLPPPADRPGHCLVVGAGLAGASVAWSLAARGWQVTVLDHGAQPAAGASGLPAGVVAPHVSPDDRPVSRLTRAGARATLARAQALLREGVDFSAGGVLERHAADQRRLPEARQNAIDSEAQTCLSLPADRPITQEKAHAAGVLLSSTERALWHAGGGWIRPATLVRALLAAPGITWRGGAQVARLVATDTGRWAAQGPDGAVLAEGDQLVIAAGPDSQALLADIDPGAAALPLHALRGQVAFGPMPGGAADAALPPFPVNGHGSLIGHLPGDDAPGSLGAAPWWIAGSTFERGNRRPELLPQDHATNRQRLAELLPAAARALDAQWPDGRAQAWAAVRATLPDRLPAVGVWQSEHPVAGVFTTKEAIKSEAKNTAPAPWLCTGFGARGLTLSVLCGDLLAAWLNGDPLPVEKSLARRLWAGRWVAT